MFVHLLRHGQTTSDVEGRYGGNYEDHLTELGCEQAEERCQRLPKVSMIISSPRVRAQETAEIFAKHLGLPVHTERDWRERNAFGILTGMLKTEAREQCPDYVEQLRDYRNTLPEAESYEEFKLELLKALDALRYKKTDVLVVTHSGPIRCILRELFGAEVKEVHACGIVSLQQGLHGWKFSGADGVVFATAPPTNTTAKTNAPPFDSWRGSTY